MKNDSSWCPKFIVLDSTELRADMSLSSTRAEFLRAFCDRHGSLVVVPQVVRLELEAHIESEVGRLAGSADDTLEKLEQFGARQPPREVTYTTRRLIRDAQRQLSERLDWLGAQNLPLPPVTHDEVVARLLRGRRPFGATKVKETGYRDFLLWRNVLSLDGPTALVTSNRRDFMNDGKLHPDLERDLRYEGRNVVLFDGLRELTESILRPSFPPMDAADMLLNRADQRQKLEDFAMNKLDPDNFLEFLWWEDILEMLSKTDEGTALPAEYVGDVLGAEVTRIVGVSLSPGPKDLRMVDERVVAVYSCGVEYALYGNFEIGGASVDAEETVGGSADIEYVLDVSGTAVMPVAVSLIDLR